MKNGNKPIYPLQDAGFPSNESVVEEGTMHGLTKREHFAALAMQALASNPEWAKMRTPDDWDEYKDRLGSGAVELADAVLEALEKK